MKLQTLERMPQNADTDAMNLQRLERIKRRWLFAADSMPQLICLVDRAGRVIHANRTLERWKLGEVERVRGLDLHQVLHRNCSDRNCQLRLLWQRSELALARDGRAECSIADAQLQRQLTIRIQLPLQEEGSASEDCFAAVVIDDVTHLRVIEEQARLSAQLAQNELWRLSAQHLTIQESERRRVAADLHDGLGQSLSLVKLSIEDASRSVRDGAPRKAAATLEHLASSVKSALADLRRMSMNLRPSTLDDLGIIATLSWYFREFEAAYPGITLERDIRVQESDVPELLKVAIFRIVQEATANALKHAAANRILVSLSIEGDALELLIEDTGRGFDLAAATGSRDFSHGLGLQSMRERAELSGASYAIASMPGKGTSVCVRWPSQGTFERKLAALSPLPTPLQPAAAERRMSEHFSQCLACMQHMSTRQGRAPLD